MSPHFSGYNDDRTDFKYVGIASQPGRQAYDMAKGVAKYSRDMTKEGMAYGRALPLALPRPLARRVLGKTLILPCFLPVYSISSCAIPAKADARQEQQTRRLDSMDSDGQSS